MRPDHHELPTPRTTLAASYVVVLVWCKSCRHQAQADMQKLIDAGRGDVPLTRLRFRCSNCRSSLTDFVCTGGRPSGFSRGERLRLLRAIWPVNRLPQPVDEDPGWLRHCRMDLEEPAPPGDERLTYAQLADRLGISRAAAQILVRRRGWQRI